MRIHSGGVVTNFLRTSEVLLESKRVVQGHSGLTTSSHSGHSAKTPTLPSSCSHSISFQVSEIDRPHSGQRPSDGESELMGNGGERVTVFPPSANKGFSGIIVLLSYATCEAAFPVITRSFSSRWRVVGVVRTNGYLPGTKDSRTSPRQLFPTLRLGLWDCVLGRSAY